MGDAAFNPAGDVVFVSLDDIVDANPDHGPELYRYDVETGDTAQLTDDAPLESGAWSGDGTTLAFASDGDPLGTNTDGNVEIFTFQVVNQAVHQVTHSIGGGLAAHWGFIAPNHSPVTDGGGHHVYFESTNSYPDGLPLDGLADGRYMASWLADVDVGTYQDAAGLGIGGTPAISASGSSLVATRATGEVAVLDLTGGDLSNLRDGAIGGSPGISDDGTTVVFLSEENVTGENPDGSTEAFASVVGSQVVRQITSSESTRAGRTRGRPILDGAGDHVLLSSQANLDGAHPFRDDALYLLDLGSGAATNVVTSVEAFEPWASDLDADGTRALFLEDDDVVGHNGDRNTELFVADCGSGAPVAEQWPDSMIGRPGASAMTGNDVYDPTGARQTRTARRGRGTTARYVVRLENDAAMVGSIQARVRRTGPVSVRYFDGAADVTSALAAGTYVTPPLDPGGVAELTAVVTVPGAARVGAVGMIAVRATPMIGDSVIHGRDDKVKLRVEVVR